MSLSDAIFTLINGDATAAALVDNRIYPNQLDQGTSFPAMYYRLDPGPDVDSKDRNIEFERPTLQLHYFARTFAQVEDLDAAVTAVLFGFQGTQNGVNIVDIRRDAGPVDQPEPDTELHHRVREFTLTIKP